MVKKMSILLFVTALSFSTISCKKEVSPLEDVNKDNLVQISMADEEIITRGQEYIVLGEDDSETLLEELKNISYKKVDNDSIKGSIYHMEIQFEVEKEIMLKTLYFYNPDKIKIDDELYRTPKETYKKFEKYF
ncbi:hypothetical protein JCM31739_03720 [Faecalimonas canis]